MKMNEQAYDSGALLKELIAIALVQSQLDRDTAEDESF